MTASNGLPPSHEVPQNFDDELKGDPVGKAIRFALASIGGAIPFVGGVAGAGAGAWSEKEQERIKNVFRAWLKLLERQIEEMGRTMAEVVMRIDTSNEEVRKRIQSDEYMSLVRKAFRDWGASESEEKRRLIRNLLSNAAQTRLASDDIVRLFIKWIADYDEAHFKIIRAVYNRNGITRLRIWSQAFGERPRDDAAEADLFGRLVHDLTVGHVVCQERRVNQRTGQIYKKDRSHGSSLSEYRKSAFDDEEGYQLTGLGNWFVHYTMNEIAPVLGPRVSQEVQENQ